MFLASVIGAFVQGEVLRGLMALSGPALTLCLFVAHRLITGIKFRTIEEIGDALLAKDVPVKERQ
jgi:hypothetical protein